MYSKKVLQTNYFSIYLLMCFLKEYFYFLQLKNSLSIKNKFK